jgi:hypothetical protein
MTAPPVHSSPHPSDGVLLALHDGERDGERRSELDAGRAHLEQCGECRTRMDAIAAHTVQVRRSLASIPIPSVSEREFGRRLASANARHSAPMWRRPGLLAAAAVVVLAGAAAASPIREWIRHHMAASLVDIQPTASSVGRDSAAPQPNRAGATISFAPVGPTFTVRLDSLPTSGSLNAAATTDAMISARVAAGAGTGGDEMVVLPGELRVPNTRASGASYEISLPSAVIRFRVIVAGHTIFDGSPPAAVRLDRLR